MHTPGDRGPHLNTSYPPPVRPYGGGGYLRGVGDAAPADEHQGAAQEPPRRTWGWWWWLRARLGR